MNSFAERLKEAMIKAGMNQAALSEKTGISKSAISQYISGKNIPGPERMKELGDAVGVSVDYLLEQGTDPIVETRPFVRKITVKEAARCMGKSDQFVRIGIQRGLLPIGNAVPGSGNSWNYYISPPKFREYVGAELFDRFFGLASQPR